MMLISARDLSKFTRKSYAHTIMGGLHKARIPMIRKQVRTMVLNAHQFKSERICEVVHVDIDLAISYYTSLSNRDSRKHVQESCKRKLEILNQVKDTT